MCPKENCALAHTAGVYFSPTNQPTGRHSLKRLYTIRQPIFIHLLVARGAHSTISYGPVCLWISILDSRGTGAFFCSSKHKMKLVSFEGQGQCQNVSSANLHRLVNSWLLPLILNKEEIFTFHFVAKHVFDSYNSQSVDFYPIITLDKQNLPSLFRRIRTKCLSNRTITDGSFSGQFYVYKYKS